VLSGISDDSITDAKLKNDTGTVKNKVNTYLATDGITDALLSGAAGTVKTLAAAHYIDYYKHGLTGTTDSSGTNTAYTLTPSPNTLSAYADYLRLSLVFDKTNGGATTINVSGLGAKSIKKVESTGKVALVAGDIQALVVTNLVYDGTDFILLNPVMNDIPKSLMTAAGDILVASGANTPARKAKGTALQVLQVNAGGTDLEYADKMTYADFSGQDLATSINSGATLTKTIPLGVSAKLAIVSLASSNDGIFTVIMVGIGTGNYKELFGYNYSPGGYVGYSPFYFFDATPTTTGISLSDIYISGTDLIIKFENGAGSPETIKANWKGGVIA
jgi:hypothetical protein